MREIRHGSRNHEMRGWNVLPAGNVSDQPELQPMLLRLGLAVGDTNASYINRVQVVEGVAAVVVKARALR